MNKPELKPCPFCGGKASYYSRIDEVAGIRWFSAICVVCDVEKHGECWPMSADQPQDAYATAAFEWNTRAKA